MKLKWEWFLIKLSIGFSTSSLRVRNIWQLSGVPDKLPFRKKIQRVSNGKLVTHNNLFNNLNEETIRAKGVGQPPSTYDIAVTEELPSWIGWTVLVAQTRCPQLKVQLYWCLILIRTAEIDRKFTDGVDSHVLDRASHTLDHLASSLASKIIKVWLSICSKTATLHNTSFFYTANKDILTCIQRNQRKQRTHYSSS